MNCEWSTCVPIIPFKFREPRNIRREMEGGQVQVHAELPGEHYLFNSTISKPIYSQPRKRKLFETNI